MQNILVAGCSFTEQCGFTKQNQPLYHWPYLLADYYKSNITNIGINAGSCEEVFYRTLEQVINQSYDYAVVVWTYPHRRWAYSSNNNVDDYTILGPPPGPLATGKNDDISDVQEYARLHYKHFDNAYMNLKRFLLQVKSLELALKNLNQKLNYYSPVIDLCEEINQAIKCKDQSKLNNLLGRGLPPNGYPNHKGAWWTCLEDNNDSTFVEYLLLNGAWVNIRNEHGFTALMLSVCMGNLKLFKLLNKYGADPLMRTFEGQNLLHLAVKNEHIKLISILLNMGLCPDMPDQKGITARHLANGSKVAKIIEIFKS